MSKSKINSVMYFIRIQRNENWEEGLAAWGAAHESCQPNFSQNLWNQNRQNGSLAKQISQARVSSVPRENQKTVT